MIFSKRHRRNEKWETINARKLRNDVLGFVFVICPGMYFCIVCMCAY